MIFHTATSTARQTAHEQVFRAVSELLLQPETLA